MNETRTVAPLVQVASSMRNLEATSCVVLSQISLLSEPHCFCLDCDSGCVWVATSEGLCKISSENEVLKDPQVVFNSSSHFAHAPFVTGLAGVSSGERGACGEGGEGGGCGVSV